VSRHRLSADRERGAALIVALVFLVILALLGTSGSMNSTMQERMASNTRNRDLAFQGAEHALVAADTWIKTRTKAALDTAAAASLNDGIRSGGETHANDLSYWNGTFNWSSADLRGPTTNLDGLAAQPRYAVEKMPDGTCPSDSLKTCSFYRVTARGVGGTSDAVVILQTMYAYK
jgi:type IV pilus assembly protein PilX